MKTVKITFKSSAPNATGLGKNSNKALQTALVNAAIEQFRKVDIKGFIVAFNLDGVVYAVKMDAETALQRVKLESGDNNLTIFSPFSREQAADVATVADVVGTFEEMAEIASRRKLTNNGYAAEYLMARHYRAKFDHKKAWYMGRGEFKGYEVKFFDFGNGKGHTSPRAKFTSRKQLEKLGYTF